MCGVPHSARHEFCPEKMLSKDLVQKLHFEKQSLEELIPEIPQSVQCIDIRRLKM
jgi:hypothetical protein